eukprot:TRINITY_DN2699_c0_g1_i3.p1 TRINITY_DN2699_c0_g1~~TRINITY_DN2699_c0_g1_i3.p1  ORF type:complete len:724 (-),score=157.28 TRINITY_DN2699_c0_g1_i3:976-2886(-)
MAQSYSRHERESMDMTCGHWLDPTTSVSELPSGPPPRRNFLSTLSVPPKKKNRERGTDSPALRAKDSPALQPKSTPVLHAKESPVLHGEDGSKHSAAAEGMPEDEGGPTKSTKSKITTKVDANRRMSITGDRNVSFDPHASFAPLGGAYGAPIRSPSAPLDPGGESSGGESPAIRSTPREFSLDVLEAQPLPSEEMGDDAIEMASLRSQQEAQEVPEMMDRDQFFTRIDFLLALTQGMQKYGLPVRHIEYLVVWAAQRFGIECALGVFPTYISVMFRIPGHHETFTYNVNSEFGYDMDKLSLVSALAEKVATNKISLRKGIMELKYIYERPARYSWWVNLFCYTLESVMVAPWFFGGGVVEALVSGVGGLFVGLLYMLASKSLVISRTVEPLSAFICAFIPELVQYLGWFGPIDTGCAMLAGVIWCLPGLTINAATTDLATHMLVSGTARLVFATLLIFEIGFGFALAMQVVALFPGYVSSSSLMSVAEVAVPTIPLSPWFWMLWTPLCSLCFAVLLGYSYKQFPPVIVSACFATILTLFSKLVGSEMATVLAQFGVIVVGNLYERIFNHPAYVATCIGSLLLMPSSIGVRGITAVIVFGDVVSAASFAYAMLFTAVSMIVGGFLANMIIWPKIQG